VTPFPSRDWFGVTGFQPGPFFYAAELYLLEDVGSTNDFLLGRGEGASGRVCRWDGWGWQVGPLASMKPVREPQAGQIVVAHRQARGHGRQGRRWLDLGGLQLSWTVSCDRQALNRGLAVWTGLIAAIALRDRLGLSVDLKWPNDLMLNGRKVGGILFETAGGVEHSFVAAGLGLNLLAEPLEFPPGLREKATSIQTESGRALRPAAVAGSILSLWGEQQSRFQEDGWPPYLERLAALDWLRGRQVALRAGERHLRGTARGVTDEGALLLQTDDAGDVRIWAGEVHLLEVGSVTETERERAHPDR
jgi:BirA family biotin operon repressor/biotin-[acetyl-CoA-carboxylase] ligase